MRRALDPALWIQSIPMLLHFKQRLVEECSLSEVFAFGVFSIPEGHENLGSTHNHNPSPLPTITMAIHHSRLFVPGIWSVCTCLAQQARWGAHRQKCSTIFSKIRHSVLISVGTYLQDTCPYLNIWASPNVRLEDVLPRQQNSPGFNKSCDERAAFRSRW